MPTPVELITAPDLEKQAQLQGVDRMKIVETDEGYELHVPLRSWLADQMRIQRSGSGQQQVVIKLSDPIWMVLRTRRAKEPRKFKNMGTIFSYIEEKFPLVENVEVQIIPAKPEAQPEPGQKAIAGKSRGKPMTKVAKKAAKKTTKRATKKATKA